jgi:hypothetical protein
MKYLPFAISMFAASVLQGRPAQAAIYKLDELNSGPGWSCLIADVDQCCAYPAKAGSFGCLNSTTNCGSTGFFYTYMRSENSLRIAACAVPVPESNTSFTAYYSAWTLPLFKQPAALCSEHATTCTGVMPQVWAETSVEPGGTLPSRRSEMIPTFLAEPTKSLGGRVRHREDARPEGLS